MYFFYDVTAESSKLAKSALTQEMEKNEESRSLQTATTEAAEPASKAPRMEAEPNTSALRGCMRKSCKSMMLNKVGPAAQLHRYRWRHLAEKTIHRMESPFEYWGKNKERFPSLAATAAKFLCTPSTSVDSERLFSTASNILHDKRNRLLGEKVETLIFLKKYLPMYLNLYPKDLNPLED